MISPIERHLIDDLHYHNKKYEIHHNVLAQPNFQFLPKGGKLAKLEDYATMKKDLAKVREIREMLENAKNDDALYSKLLSNTKEFFSILKEVENEGEDEIRNGTFDKLNKT